MLNIDSSKDVNNKEANIYTFLKQADSFKLFLYYI